MLDRSWHTHQINLWIALSQPDDTFTTTLADLGYECDVIEDRFYILDDDGNDVIQPDVVLTGSDAEHSLVVDCKAETVDNDQLQRYLRVEGNEEQLVVQGLVDGVDPNNLTADIVLSSFSDLGDAPVLDGFAVVHFDQDTHSGLAIWNLEGYPFSNADVADVFPVNQVPGQPLPTGHYPFDVYEADKEAMVAAVFSAVVSLAMSEREFSIEDVLDRSHPYWNKLGSGKRDELRERVNVVHLELLDAGLDEYLEKIAGTEGREWRRTSATIQAVQGETEHYVDQVLNKLPQARLDHHAWAADSDDED